jgi:hypothetical protein
MRMRERMARVQKKNNEKPCMSETAAKVDMPMILRTTRTERDEREGGREREREREKEREHEREGACLCLSLVRALAAGLREAWRRNTSGI